MQGFEQIVGHEDIIQHLQNAILADKVSHSYIFAGEPGAGKKLLTSLFAMTLQCREQKKDPCLNCDSCKKALSKNHPDIIYVYHSPVTDVIPLFSIIPRCKKISVRI